VLTTLEVLEYTIRKTDTSTASQTILSKYLPTLLILFNMRFATTFAVVAAALTTCISAAPIEDPTSFPFLLPNGSGSFSISSVTVSFDPAKPSICTLHFPNGISVDVCHP